MSDQLFPCPEELSKNAHVKSMEEYKKLYDESISDPDGFWTRMANEQVDWFKPFDKVREFDFHKAEIKWFIGGKLNICHNCVDRHLEKRADQAAIIWEGNTPGEERIVTYKELHKEVSEFANVLKANGVKKGDRVTLYMPMIPELAVALLACARIGAMHSVVFGGFSADALKGRIIDAQSAVVVTTDELLRGTKVVPMKATTDVACDGLDVVEKVIVFKRTGNEVNMVEGRDVWWNDEIAKVDANCPCEEMDSEDPLFLLYTSGSTGKPKGVLHTTGGYNVYTSLTHKYVFDYQEGDIYWCTADIGWVTGHSYIVYGPLSNGATTIMFEGIPTFPDGGRFWEVVDKWKVNIFYTAPTAIRALAGLGDEIPAKYDLSSLKVLGTVGEPINPEAWTWYHNSIGHGNCPIVDTWWQTETGGILITPLPGAIAQKPGSATLPFFGVKPHILDAQTGEEQMETEASGVLAISESWPGQMRTVYGDSQRFFDTYFSQYPGYYFSGDGCRRDADGYYWITGRVDDVMNISGHRLGTAEVETAILLHDDIAEAAVVACPDDITGWSIYAYVVPMAGKEPSDELAAEIKKIVRKEISPIATPKFIQFAAAGLPKTRSGKVMRRILRKIVERDVDQIGDTSTLADPSVVTALIDGALVK